MKKFVIFIASMSLVLSPLVFAQKQTGSGGSRNNGGGNATNVNFNQSQFNTNGSSQIQIKVGSRQTNGAFWSDGTTFGLKAIGDVGGVQDAIRQFEFTTDGTTGYKLFGNGVQKWALNSDGSGSGTGLLTVGSLATTGSTGTLLVSDSSVVVTNTTTHDNIVISTNGTITINGTPVGASGGGLQQPFSTTGRNLVQGTRYYLGFASANLDSTLTSYGKVIAPKAMTVKSFYLTFNYGNSPSTENVSFYVTNYTQATGTASTLAQIGSPYSVSATGLSLSLASQDYWGVIIETPTMTTPPTSFAPVGTVYCE